MHIQFNIPNMEKNAFPPTGARQVSAPHFVGLVPPVARLKIADPRFLVLSLDEDMQDSDVQSGGVKRKEVWKEERR